MSGAWRESSGCELSHTNVHMVVVAAARAGRKRGDLRAARPVAGGEVRTTVKYDSTSETATRATGGTVVTTRVDGVQLDGNAVAELARTAR